MADCLLTPNLERVTDQATQRNQLLRQNPQEKAVQLPLALTVTSGLFERRFADRTIDVQGSWASGPQAVESVPIP